MAEKKSKVSKADIGFPTDFKHLVHVGWASQDLGLDTFVEEVDPITEELLQKLNIQSWKLKQEDKKFLRDFVGRHSDELKNGTLPRSDRNLRKGISLCLKENFLFFIAFFDFSSVAAVIFSNYSTAD